MPWLHKISRLSRPRRGSVCLAISLLLFSGSFALRFALEPLLANLKFLTFYPAIAAAALICGWAQGVFVLMLSAVAAWYFFIEPSNSFAPRDAQTLASLVGFLLVGGFIVLLVNALRETIHRLEQAKVVQETLFRELQHRVANNLQVVVSMLRNAQRNVGEPAATAKTLTEAEERIWAMAQLHRRLNDGSAYANELEPLLKELLAETFRELPISVRVDVQGASDLSIDQITAMTLLVNEAALNAAKHVFRKGLGTHFNVSLAKQDNGRLQLLIVDDGPGMDSASRPAGSRSFGVSLMQAFATQLGGSLELAHASGTALSVEFAAK